MWRPLPALLPPRQTGLRPGPRETLHLVLLHSCSLLASPHAAHGLGGLSLAPRLSQVGPAPAASPGRGPEMHVPTPLPGLQAQNPGRSRYSAASSAFTGLRRAPRTGCTSRTAGTRGHSRALTAGGSPLRALHHKSRQTDEVCVPVSQGDRGAAPPSGAQRALPPRRGPAGVCAASPVPPPRCPRADLHPRGSAGWLSGGILSPTQPGETAPRRLLSVAGI